MQISLKERASVRLSRLPLFLSDGFLSPFLPFAVVGSGLPIPGNAFSMTAAADAAAAVFALLAAAARSSRCGLGDSDHLMH